jgi:hypothetical protein
MFIMKLALLSCAIYLGLALIAELALFGLMYWKDGVFVSFTWWGWTVLSSAAWLVSTTLAFRLVMAGILPRSMSAMGMFQQLRMTALYFSRTNCFAASFSGNPVP